MPASHRTAFQPFKHRGWWRAVALILVLMLSSKPLYHALFQSGTPEALPLLVQTVRVKTAPMSQALKTVGVLEAKTELILKAGAAGRVEQY